MLRAVGVGASRPHEVVLPTRESLLLHPDGVVLADVRFVGVIAKEADVLEAVEGLFVVLPEV